MSEPDRRWGVVEEACYVGNLSKPIYKCVPTEYPQFYQRSLRLKASGLTEEETEAMCKLLNAGRGNG